MIVYAVELEMDAALVHYADELRTANPGRIAEGFEAAIIG